MNSDLPDFIETLRGLCNRADIYAKGTVTTDQIRSLCNLWLIKPEPMYSAAFTNVIVNNQYVQQPCVDMPYKSFTLTLVSSI